MYKIQKDEQKEHFLRRNYLHKILLVFLYT